MQCVVNTSLLWLITCHFRNLQIILSTRSKSVYFSKRTTQRAIVFWLPKLLLLPLPASPEHTRETSVRGFVCLCFMCFLVVWRLEPVHVKLVINMVGIPPSLLSVAEPPAPLAPVSGLTLRTGLALFSLSWLHISFIFNKKKRLLEAADLRGRDKWKILSPVATHSAGSNTFVCRF